MSPRARDDQLARLRRLAVESGETFVTPLSERAASREIARLELARRRPRRRERITERLAEYELPLAHERAWTSGDEAA